MNEVPATAADAAKAAQTIRDAAREHKRLAQHHRREAQRLMARHAAFRARCAELGIHFDPDTAPQEAK